MGVPGRESKMIPVTVAMHIQGSTARRKRVSLRSSQQRAVSPVAMMATVFNALHGTNEYGEDITYRMNGVLSVKGYPDVTLRNMFARKTTGSPRQLWPRPPSASALDASTAIPRRSDIQA